MSSYNGRRVPNFSQFLEDLNTIPSPYDQALQQQDDSFNIDAELALFTNAEFLDFDDMSIPLTYEPLEGEASQFQNVVEAKNANAEADCLDLLTSESDTPSITSLHGFCFHCFCRRDLSSYDTTIEIRAFPSWQPYLPGVRISSSYLILSVSRVDWMSWFILCPNLSCTYSQPLFVCFIFAFFDMARVNAYTRKWWLSFSLSL